METFLEEESPWEKISDRELFARIWISPRETFQYLQTQQYDGWLYVLIFLSGIARGFENANSRNLGDDSTLLSILLKAILAGGLLGWIPIYIYLFLISLTGNWLKGKADTNTLMRIFAWSMIPALLGFLLYLPNLWLFGVEIFKKKGDFTSAGGAGLWFYYGSTLFNLALSVWSMALLVVGIAEVQKFSLSKALLNLILPALLFLIPIGGLAWLIFELLGN